MAKREHGGFNFSSLRLNLDLAASLGSKEKEFIRAATLNRQPVAFDNALEMAREINPAQDYFAFVSGKFIFGDFIEALIHAHDLRPSSVYITTLGMGKNNVDSIVNLTEYLGCEKVNLIVSNYFVSVERHKLVPYMIQEFTGRPIDVAVLASHCKICLIEPEAGPGIVMAGSANLSSRNNVEQFEILHDENLLSFLRGRLDEIMRRFTVIHGESGKTIFENNKNNLSKVAYKILSEEADCNGKRQRVNRLEWKTGKRKK